MSRTGVSVCIPAFNEAKNILRAINSVKPIADEIIVVDNGSTDDTVSICEQAGAKVVHHQWNENLSESRNAAWAHVRNRWTFWIDADEVLLPDARPIFAECVERDDVLAYALIRKDYETGTGVRGFVGITLIRFVRADQGILWTGRYHEQLDPPLEQVAEKTGLKILGSKIVLDHHCDYFGAGRRPKQQRNAALLLKEIEDRPGRMYFTIQCAAALLDLGDPRGHEIMAKVAQEISDKHRDAPHAPLPVAFFVLEYCVVMPLSKGLPITPDEGIALMERWYPKGAPVLWHLARRDHQQGRFESAIQRLRQLIDLGRTHDYDLNCPFEPSIIGEDARINLAVCLIRVGELPEARKLLQMVKPASPRYGEAVQNLRVIEGLLSQFGAKK